MQSPRISSHSNILIFMILNSIVSLISQSAQKKELALHPASKRASVCSSSICHSNVMVLGGIRRASKWHRWWQGSASSFRSLEQSWGKKKFSNNQGQTSWAPIQIATPRVPVNRCEAVPILTESPTWQQDNNSKLIVAGFCLCQKEKKVYSLRPLGFWLY